MLLIWNIGDEGNLVTWNIPRTTLFGLVKLMKRYRLTKQNGNRAVFNEDFAKQSIDSVSLQQRGGFKFYDLII